VAITKVFLCQIFIYAMILNCIFPFNTIAKTAHVVLLQGFHDANVGYEINFNNVLVNALFAGGTKGDNSLDIRGNFHIGEIFALNLGTELCWTIGCKIQYLNISYTRNDCEKDYSGIPSANIILRKWFNIFLVGGNVGLDICKIYSQERQAGTRRWHLSRLFDVEPEFIIGYRF
jgi:hypothetical protein